MEWEEEFGLRDLLQVRPHGVTEQESRGPDLEEPEGVGGLWARHLPRGKATILEEPLVSDLALIPVGDDAPRRIPERQGQRRLCALHVARRGEAEVHVLEVFLPGRADLVTAERVEIGFLCVRVAVAHAVEVDDDGTVQGSPWCATLSWASVVGNGGQGIVL